MEKHCSRRFFLVLLLASAAVCTATPAEAVVDSFEVRDISFVGSEMFDDDQLYEMILEREGPGFPSRFLYSIFGEALGSKPQVFQKAVLQLDVEKLRRLYHAHGFFEAAIRDSLVFDTSSAAVDVFFLIEENRRSRIDSLDYRGLEGIDPAVMNMISTEPMLYVGMMFDEARIGGEIDRILRIMENEGYATTRFDKERSFVSRYLSTGNVHVVVAFTVGRRLQFGDVRVTIDPPREDITEDIVLKRLDFTPGDVYSREKRISSERNLNRLGVFEAARIDAVPTAKAETTGVVPVEISVRPRDKHELNPEITVSDENNSFNLSIGLGYTNRNFLGDARSFTARARLRTQSIQEWDFGGIRGGRGLRDPSVLGAAEIQFHIAQPYLFTRSLSGTWTFSLSAEKEHLYILPIVRNKIGLINQFAEFTIGFFDWTLERVSAEFLQDTVGAKIALNRLREEERPQFNSIFSITLQRDKTNDIFSPTDGFLHSVTLEESGILPKLLQNLQPDLPFTQFYKVSLMGKWFRDATRTRYNIFAFKLRAGYQDKYGESKRQDSIRIPLNRRFFAGGSGSVRGWKSRDLGAMPDNELQLGGNFILEGSYEMRINYFRGFGKLWFLDLDNIWVVYFLDAGNVWTDLRTFQTRDVALAMGVGIRYDTLFGPFRIDYGFRVYDPKERQGRQWLIHKRFFGDVLANGVVHFGLGHAF